jgi:imidazolonepropionase-like amidohydrolase
MTTKIIKHDRNVSLILLAFCFLGFIFSCQHKAKVAIPPDAMAIRNGIVIDGMAQQEIVMVPTVSALIKDMYSKSERSTHEQFVVLALLDIIRRFRDAGGIVAVGNDFNDRFMKERLPLTEMRALLEAGMTSMEVIEAATRHAALVSGADDLGTLEPGKLADLVVVDGNPLEDIDALARTRLVILDGEVDHKGLIPPIPSIFP